MSNIEGQPIQRKPEKNRIHNLGRWIGGAAIVALPVFAHNNVEAGTSSAPQTPVTTAMGNEASHVYNNIPRTYISAVATDAAGNVKADYELNLETTDGKSNYAFYKATAKHKFDLVNIHLPRPEKATFYKITPASDNPNDVLLSGLQTGQTPSPLLEVSTNSGKTFIDMSHAKNAPGGEIDARAIPGTSKVLLNSLIPGGEGTQDFGIFDFKTNKFSINYNAGTEWGTVGIQPDKQNKKLIDILSVPQYPGFSQDAQSVESQYLDETKLNLQTLTFKSKTLNPHFTLDKISPVRNADGQITDLIGVTPDGNGGEEFNDYNLKAGKIIQKFPFSKYNFPEDLTVESIIKVKDNVNDNVYFSGSKIPGTVFIANFKDKNQKVTDEKILNDPNMEGQISDLQEVIYGGQKTIRAEAPNGINIFPIRPNGSLEAEHVSDAWLANNGIKLPLAEG